MIIQDTVCGDLVTVLDMINVNGTILPARVHLRQLQALTDPLPPLQTVPQHMCLYRDARVTKLLQNI